MVGTHRSKRVRRQIDNDQNRWVISYADLITLLFALFVVLYAASTINVKKYSVVASAMEYAFENSPKNQSLVLQSYKHKSLSPGIYSDPKSTFLATNAHYKYLGDEISNLKIKFMSISNHGSWYEIDMKAKALFKSGQATLKTEAIRALTKLAKILQNNNGPIVVEGFTDNIPINTSRYPSNWALSSARAAVVADLLDKNGLRSKQISAIGYGSQFSIASNKTEQGREKNRRVVIIIAKNNKSNRILNPQMTGMILFKESDDEFAQQQKKMKEVRTKSGGVKFTQSIE